MTNYKWYTFEQADKVFTPFKVTVNENDTLEMLEAEVCHDGKVDLDHIKQKWYEHENTYRWKGKYNGSDFTFEYVTSADHYEIQGIDITDQSCQDIAVFYRVLTEYLILACYRNQISIPGNFEMFNADIKPKMEALMNDYSYEEYYETRPVFKILDYNKNTLRPKTEAERKVIAESNASHIKITKIASHIKIEK